MDNVQIIADDLDTRLKKLGVTGFAYIFIDPDSDGVVWCMGTSSCASEGAAALLHRLVQKKIDNADYDDEDDDDVNDFLKE